VRWEKARRLLSDRLFPRKPYLLITLRIFGCPTDNLNCFLTIYPVGIILGSNGYVMSRPGFGCRSARLPNLDETHEMSETCRFQDLPLLLFYATRSRVLQRGKSHRVVRETPGEQSAVNPTGIRAWSHTLDSAAGRLFDSREGKFSGVTHGGIGPTRPTLFRHKGPRRGTADRNCSRAELQNTCRRTTREATNSLTGCSAVYETEELHRDLR
jgi:hypothetical protein